MLFGTVAAVLVVVGGALYVLRLREQAASERVTDEMIEQIEETGRVELEEPLDFSEIADEESQFWDEEPWDEADEY